MLVVFSLKSRTSQRFQVLLHSTEGTEGVDQNNKTKKEIKGYLKGRSNFLFIDNMVVSIENPRKSVIY